MSEDQRDSNEPAGTSDTPEPLVGLTRSAPEKEPKPEAKATGEATTRDPAPVEKNTGDGQSPAPVKSGKPEASADGTAQNPPAPPAPAPVATGETTGEGGDKSKSKYLDGEQPAPDAESLEDKARREFKEKLKKYLEIDNFAQPDLELALQRIKKITGDHDNLVVELVNSHTLECRKDAITISKAHIEEFDQKDAHAMVALASARGWDEIQVHGSKRIKDLLWLEAKKQNLKVTNYDGSPEANAQWEEYQSKLKNRFGEAAEKVEITPDPQAATITPAGGKPPAHPKPAALADLPKATA